MNTEQKLDFLVEKVSSMDIRMEKMEVTMGRMETEVKSIDMRLKKVETKVESMDARLEKVETKVESMDARLDRVEKDIVELKDMDNGIYDEVQRVHRILLEHKRNLQAHLAIS
ncbi:MAG: hypothetical protein J5986_08715 [Roseburia sp.]|nr:hypothetical protein [Roseburia sp.]